MDPIDVMEETVLRQQLLNVTQERDVLFREMMEAMSSQRLLMCQMIATHRVLLEWLNTQTKVEFVSSRDAAPANLPESSCAVTGTGPGVVKQGIFTPDKPT